MASRRSTRAVSLLLSVAVSVPGPLLAQENAQSPAALTAFRAGQEAFQKEDFDAAAAQFKAAIAADPRFAAAYCALGQTDLTTRRYPEAVDALVQCKAATERQIAGQASKRAEQERAMDREIIELRDSINLIRSGTVKSADENTILRIEERLRKLEQERNRGAAERAAVPPPILFALGTAYLRVGNLEGAERELQQAVKQQPAFGDAHNNLAAVYVGLGRWEEAAREVQLAEGAGRPVSPALKADIAARHSSVPVAPSGSASTPAPAAAEAAPPSPPPPLAIAHDPLACVASSSFPRVVARVTPDSAASAKVFFKTHGDKDWFAVRLRSDDERFAALLPRPRSTRSFRYYIEATGDDAKTTRTPEYVTAVVDRPEQCAGRKTDGVARASGIIVEPPATAKGRPVPAGFSARGTVGDVGQFEMGTKLAIGAGVLVAGAAVAGAAAAAAKGVQGAPVTTIASNPAVAGDIALVGTNPAAGSTVSLAGTPVSVTMRVFSPYAVAAGPALLQFAHNLPQNGFVTFCASLTGTHPDIPANTSLTITVSGAVGSVNGCGDRFDVHSARVTLTEGNGGRQVLGTGTGFISDLPVVLSFVP